MSTETLAPTRRGLTGQEIALVAVFAALLGALGQIPAIPLPEGMAPVTAQTLGVMLAGLLIGPRLGTLSLLTFHALLVAGLPLLPDSASRPRGGLGVYVSGSGGFLLGWILGAFVVGLVMRPYVVQLRNRITLGAALASVVGGIAVIYIVGIPFLGWVTGMGFVKASALGMAYLPGDLLKAGLATAIAAGVHRGYPQLATHFTRNERIR